MVKAVEAAREAVPGYGAGTPVTTGDVRRLCAAFRLRVVRAVDEMDSPAVLTPPLNGFHRLVIAPRLHPLVVRHVTLHEVGHVLMGDIDEPTFLTWSGPMPSSEDAADLFSLVGILDEIECRQGSEFLETRIRELVPLDDRGWQQHRVERLASKVGRVKEAIREEACP